MKILVIRFSSIGDIILTSPVVRALKKHFPSAEVHFLTKRQNADLVANNPNLNRLHLFNKRLKPMLRELKQEGYDYVIDLHHNLRTWRVKRRLRVPSFSFKKLNFKKWLLTTLKINILPNIHIVDRYMATLKRWGIVNDKQGLDFTISPDILLPSFFNEPKPFVALVLGANHATKKIPYSQLLFLCKHIDYQIVLLGGHKESQEGEQLAQDCANVRSFCGKMDISQSAKVLQISQLVITPDTGLMHIAAALKKDIFSVWGNTVPDFGMSPYMAGAKSQIFEVKGLKCRPCSKIGYANCPRKHFNCMQQQNMQHIADEVNQYMSYPPPAPVAGDSTPFHHSTQSEHCPPSAGQGC